MRKLWPGAGGVADAIRGISLRGRLRSNAHSLDDAFHTLAAEFARGRQKHRPPNGWWTITTSSMNTSGPCGVIRRLRRPLPKLSNGPYAAIRVYGLAWAIIAHSDNCFEPDTLLRFCRAYQRIEPSPSAVVGHRHHPAGVADRNEPHGGGSCRGCCSANGPTASAHEWLADEPVRATPHRRVAGLREQTLPNAFGVQLFQRLRDRDPETMPPLAWLHRAVRQGTTADDVVHGEHQRQGVVNVSVRNVITSCA